MEHGDSIIIIFPKKLSLIIIHLSLLSLLIVLTFSLEEVNAASFVPTSSSSAAASFETMSSLIPSQALSSKNHRESQITASTRLSRLRNSHVIVQTKRENNNEDDEAGDDIIVNEEMFSSSKGKKDVKTKKNSKLKAKSSPPLPNYYKISNNRVKTKKNHKRVISKRSGNLPDIHWRVIPMDHLRLHPKFKALPLVEDIRHLSCLEDVRYFRQDSWQWDVLHFGRCTTSQAASALGFLEPNAAFELAIPRSLQSKGRRTNSAFLRLSQGQPLTTLEHMNQQLITSKENNDNNHDNKNIQNHNANNKKSSTVWESMTLPPQYKNTKNLKDNKEDDLGLTEKSTQVRRLLHRPSYPFAAKYIPTISKTDLKKRKKEANKYFTNEQNKSAMRARMNWGNTQEATSILTALNYLWKKDPNIIIEEVGMCGAGLKLNQTLNTDEQKKTTDKIQLLVGASPDAIVRYSNGTLEALEVKNHCPFVNPHRNYKKKKGNQTMSNKMDDDFMIRTMDLSPTVPAVYISQLMMEMLCLGPSCTSVLMVRQTATNGAVILRLRRDNDWLEEMIYWLQRFISDYVNKDQPPPVDFFWKEKRYQNFIKQTKNIQKHNVELVDYVQHSSIQRALPRDKNDILPLFLDNA